MGSASTVYERMIIRPPSEALEIQREAIAAFGWPTDLDRNAVESVIAILGGKLAHSEAAWRRLSDTLSNDGSVAVIGADINPEAIDIHGNERYVVADGAFAAFNLVDSSVIKRIHAIVTDADGGEGVIQAMAHPHLLWILHPHSDNLDEIVTLAQHLVELGRSVVVTHQLEEEIDGAINVGGITDGDRAACIARCVLIPTEIKLKGFSTNQLGRWSNHSNQEMKLLKLDWMARVLDALGFNGFRTNQPKS